MVTMMDQLPEMYRLRQIFPRPRVNDIPAAVMKELDKLHLSRSIEPGQKIGITAGSRGIQNLGSILKTVIDQVRSLGASPRVLAAMGSHGGGTERGQKEVLDSLLLNEEVLGAEVVTCAECEIIARTGEGLPVFTVGSATAVDGIIVVNRVKTHTSFKGKVESGLVKMLVVGLGGPKGAQQFHGFGPEELPRLLVEIGEVILQKLPVLGGLGIVENAYEETAAVQAITARGMIEEEGAQLRYSKSLMPSLPADKIDLLIIQEMGKNFSGTGIDTNIIGRARIHGVPEPTCPRIKRIAVLDLSDESHGNATGVGMADFVTRTLVEKMDRKATYLNCLTSTFVVRAAIPMYFETEKELLEAALYSLSSIPREELRVVIVPNTLFLTDCYVSKAVAGELQGKKDVEIANEPEQLTFSDAGRILLRI